MMMKLMRLWIVVSECINWSYFNINHSIICILDVSDTTVWNPTSDIWYYNSSSSSFPSFTADKMFLGYSYWNIGVVAYFVDFDVWPLLFGSWLLDELLFMFIATKC